MTARLKRCARPTKRRRVVLGLGLGLGIRIGMKVLRLQKHRIDSKAGLPEYLSHFKV